MSTWEQMLDELVRERGPALVRYAYLFTSNRTAAEDLVQEALTRCFSRDRTCPDGARAAGMLSIQALTFGSIVKVGLSVGHAVGPGAVGAGPVPAEAAG